jgi:hypothetical protein
MHVNNVRYMMATTAAASGYRADEAIAWAEESIAYARATGNDHELAHATLAKAGLAPGPDTAEVLDGAIDAFRAVGDLRCLTRCYLLQARQLAPEDQPVVLDRALEVATRANDAAHQATALEQLIAAHWAAGDPHTAAVHLGRLMPLVGEAEATSRCPDGLREHLDEWRTAIAEGRARSQLG